MIWESNTILRYLAASSTPPSSIRADAAERSRCRALDGLAAGLAEPPIWRSSRTRRSRRPSARRPSAADAKDLAAQLKILDGASAASPTSPAPCSLWPISCLGPIVQRCLDFPIELPALPNLRAWRDSSTAAAGLQEGDGRREGRMMTRSRSSVSAPWAPASPRRLARGGMTVTAFDADAGQRAKAPRTASTSRPGVLDAPRRARPQQPAPISVTDEPRRTASPAPTSSSRTCPRISSQDRGLPRDRGLIAPGQHRRLRHVRHSDHQAPGRYRHPGADGGHALVEPAAHHPDDRGDRRREDLARDRGCHVATRDPLIGLLPVVVKKDVPGFVENRVLYAHHARMRRSRGAAASSNPKISTPASPGASATRSPWSGRWRCSIWRASISTRRSARYLNKELCNRDDTARLRDRAHRDRASSA